LLGGPDGPVGPNPTSTLVANSSRASGNAGFASPGRLTLPSFRPNDPRREFATSVNIDTGGEFIFLPARELGEDPRQTEKDTTPAPDCLRRPQPHVTAPPTPLGDPRRDPPRCPCRLPQRHPLPPDRRRTR